MRVNLKKALKVRKALETVLAKPVLKTSVEASIFSDAFVTDFGNLLADGQTAMQARYDELLNLSRILCEIRIAIASANVAYGIESLLARQAEIDRHIALLKPMANAKPAVGYVEFSGEMAIAKKALNAEDAYGIRHGASRSVEFSVVSVEMKESAARGIARLQRERESLEDERVVLNARHEIEIAEADVEVLQNLGFM